MWRQNRLTERLAIETPIILGPFPPRRSLGASALLGE